jgi:hypothetical protein
MTNLVFLIDAEDEDTLPDFKVRCFPGDGSNRSEMAAALLISTTARMIIEQLILVGGGCEPYQFHDDANMVRLKERFEKCGITIKIDRAKLMKGILKKK